MASWSLGGITVTSGAGLWSAGIDTPVVGLLEEMVEGVATLPLDPKPHGFKVDPGNDWSVDRYVRWLGGAYDLDVRTDYVASDDGMPPDVKDFVEATRLTAAEQNDYGVVY